MNWPGIGRLPRTAMEQRIEGVDFAQQMGDDAAHDTRLGPSFHRVMHTSLFAGLHQPGGAAGSAERSSSTLLPRSPPHFRGPFRRCPPGCRPMANCSGRSAPLPARRRRRLAASSCPRPASSWAGSTTARSSARSASSDPRRALAFSRAFRASSARRPACSDSERAKWASWTAWATRSISAKRSLQAAGVSSSRSAWAMRAATDLMVPRGTQRAFAGLCRGPWADRASRPEAWASGPGTRSKRPDKTASAPAASEATARQVVTSSAGTAPSSRTTSPRPSRRFSPPGRGAPG